MYIYIPQSHCGDNWEDKLFSWLHIYDAQLATHTYIYYIIYIYIYNINM